MRARQRHFNPKDAGAFLALDSRYGFSLSDGATISTWDDRSDTNNAIQNTSARQPTYETNELNGQPVVRFNASATAANCDEMVVSLATSVTSNALSWFTISKKTNAALPTTTYSRILALNNGVNNDFGTTSGMVMLAQTEPTTADLEIYRNSTSITLLAANYNTYYIFSATLNVTNVNSKRDGANSTNGTTSATALNSSKINLGGINYFTTDSFLSGDIALAIVIRSAVSDSLRKRLEHASAYSFKIACS